jgi:hypothetical protein
MNGRSGDVELPHHLGDIPPVLPKQSFELSGIVIALGEGRPVGWTVCVNPIFSRT